MDTLAPGVSADAAGEAVEAATPELEQQNESQQVETTEVAQNKAQDQLSDESQKSEGEGTQDAPETKSQRQRRLKRERQAERTRKLEENRKRLEEIAKAESELKDPAFDAYDDPDARTAEMAVNRVQRHQFEQDRKRLESDIAAAEAEAMRERNEKFSQADVEARTRYTDYDAKITVFRSVTQDNPSPALMDALASSDNPADLAYYLGNNPEEAALIQSLPDLAAAREIGRIEAGLSIPQPKTKTNAPPPIKPIQGGNAEIVKDAADMTFAEYEAARKAGKL